MVLMELFQRNVSKTKNSSSANLNLLREVPYKYGLLAFHMLTILKKHSKMNIFSINFLWRAHIILWYKGFLTMNLGWLHYIQVVKGPMNEGGHPQGEI